MTYRVTINKETRLGLAENPFAKYDMFSVIINRNSSDFIEFQKSNISLPVFASDNIQVLEGTWECEKVWQGSNDKIEWGYRDDGNYLHYRQIYKVVLPVKEEAIDVRQAARDYVNSSESEGYIKLPFISMFIAGANFQKQQTIDKVVELVKIYYAADCHIDELLTKIKELK